MSGHYGIVVVAGSTHAPGGFLWRCQCGARSRWEHQSWDAAEDELREHQTAYEEEA